MSELDNLQVFGETEVGWCEKTQPNETLDDHGNLRTENRQFGVADPRTPTRRVYDDDGVQQLREKLEKDNGYVGLDICSPDEIERAKTIFFRDGFVVVENLLNEEQLATFREGSARVLREILEPDGHDGRKYLTETNRLPHRYSYGTTSASRQLLHDHAWASMIDLETTTPIMEALFGSEDYVVLGAGGDLCLPGAIEYQHLHADLYEGQQTPERRVQQAERLGVKLNKIEDSDELDLRTRRGVVDHTPPCITINFLMSDLTWENGPIRQIPGSHKAVRPPPPPSEEPEWMRMCTLVGAKAGAGVFRDNRAWHGATPNLSREIRSLPNIEYGAPWIAGRNAKTMTHEIYETLSDHAKHLCRFVTADPGVWPPGAGFNHALAAKRRERKEADEARMETQAAAAG